MTNILILSAGTRNKIVQYFKNTLSGNGMVVATDMSELAPAIYEADKHYIVPGINSDNYIDIIIEICKENNISGVLSLIDPELNLLAANQEKFKKIGTTVIGSPYEQCQRALDKYLMYQWLLDHDFNCAKSFCSIEDFENALRIGEISFPVFVKPRWGSASISVSKVNDVRTLKLLCNGTDDYIIQEFLDGQEIGADVYIDMISKEVVSIFTKKKIKMRAGETDKAVSFKDDLLFKLIEKYSSESGFLGPIDIDIFKIKDQYYISEVNPRFGGGYPHAFECGCNHMQFIISNLEGKSNNQNIGLYPENVYMMKYNEIKVKY